MSQNKNPNPYQRPTVVASVVLLLGIAASLAINLKAVSLAPHAEMGAYISGIGWPVALLVSIELLIHTPWRKGWADRATKAGVLVLVAGVAAWISYWHGAHVLSHWGYDEVARYVGPLIPDAAMALATLALQRVGQAKRGQVVKDVATVATEPVAKVATVMDAVEARGQAAINRMMAEAVATDPLAMPTLDEDWGGLEEELDRDLAEMIEQGKTPAVDEITNPFERLEARRREMAGQVAVKLTAVPALAAKRIQEALDAGLDAKALVALDATLTEEGLAGSARTARRWRAALANGTARVS